MMPIIGLDSDGAVASRMSRKLQQSTAVRGDAHEGVCGLWGGSGCAKAVVAKLLKTTENRGAMLMSLA